ncbi:MAG: hypothetical protein A2Z40_04240 [Deltaproteobacteria bacterium RBG_19FT_COMBO_60_16]|nr:MAG: hypothetical protein A2Z40_04240 [Deltaproteobacteria bacterium RBG_19FT_COMBO_60_16]
MTRFSRLPWARERRRGSGAAKNWETSEIMEPIREVCKRLHIRCERNATGMAKGVRSPDQWLRLHSAGTWDLTVYLPDARCVVMVECKLAENDLEPEQVEWGEIYRRCGLERIVATSVDQFLRELDMIRNRRNRERT